MIDELIKQKLQDLNYEAILTMLKNLNSGKKIRSKLILSIAPESQKTYELCAVIELIHLASLLHDDIIDESKMRRGSKSVYVEFGAKNALILGDILYAKAFYELSKLGHDFSLIISDAVSKLAIGELMDVNLSKSFNTSKEAYLKMIYNKTAVLIEASARCAAIIAGFDERAFKEYGKNLGLAFQMIDDILDIKGDEERLGKPVMSDFKEGKTTLPYIYLYEALEDKDKLKSLFKKELKEDEIFWLKKNMIESKALKKAIDETREYGNLALNAIKIYENHKLIEIIKTVIDRDF